MFRLPTGWTWFAFCIIFQVFLQKWVSSRFERLFSACFGVLFLITSSLRKTFMKPSRALSFENLLSPFSWGMHLTVLALTGLRTRKFVVRVPTACCSRRLFVYYVLSTIMPSRGYLTIPGWDLAHKLLASRLMQRVDQLALLCVGWFMYSFSKGPVERAEDFMWLRQKWGTDWEKLPSENLPGLTLLGFWTTTYVIATLWRRWRISTKKLRCLRQVVYMIFFLLPAILAMQKPKQIEILRTWRQRTSR